MLGDSGINLSGGQKTRLGLARSLYAGKDIVIMDDPISALDINVGKFIMEETIKGYLKDKTRVIATHAIAYLKYFDYIYIIDEGKIINEGDYEFIKQTNEYKEIQNIIQQESTKRNEELKLEDEKAQDTNKWVKKTCKSSVGFSPIQKDNRKISRNTFTSLITIISEEDSKSIDDETANSQNDEKQEVIKLKEDQADLVANIIEDEENGRSKFQYSTWKKFLNLRGGFKFLFMQIIAISSFKVLNMKQDWFIQEWGTSETREIKAF